MSRQPIRVDVIVFSALRDAWPDTLAVTNGARMGHRPTLKDTRDRIRKMPFLQVRQLAEDYVYRDVIMVNGEHRKDKLGRAIKEGQVCLVSAWPSQRPGEKRKCFAVLRGYQASKEPRIHMDEYTREEKLGVREKESYEFEFRPVGLFGQLRWAWNATEMGYQVSSKLAVLGFVMGGLGLLFSIAGLFDWHDRIVLVLGSACLAILVLAMLGLAMPGRNGQMTKLWNLKADWLTAIFTGILAVTAVGALWYARDQIRETREESEVQIKEARQQAQIQHLLALVNEFDQEPMATYRRGLAQKRLKGTDSDPMELYRLLDFFETVGVLVNRGYLNEEDVWSEFGHWVLTLNADAEMHANVAYEQKRDPTEYAVYQSLVDRLQRVDAAHHGPASQISKEDVMAFYREELTIVGGTPITANHH